MIYVLIAGSKAALELLEHGVGIKNHGVPGILDENCRCNDRRVKLLVDTEASNSRRYFEDLATEFSHWVMEDQVTVLVSDVRPRLLNPLSHPESGIEPLLALLVLAFPEVHWLFGTIRGYQKVPTHHATDEGDGEKSPEQINNDELDYFRASHGLHNLFEPEHSVLFDASGLRDWVRQCAIDDSKIHVDAYYLPLRRQLAVAIDEETDYTHLHAYTAYRFGFRTLAISDRAAADAVLRAPKEQPWKVPYITLEDLFLNFPDGGYRLSDLRTRHKAFSVLEDTTHRILVTSGQRVDGDDEKNARNKQYIGEQRSKGKKIQFLYKPHAGIFSVWKKSGLNHKLRWNDEYGKVHRGTGEPYVWPPDWQTGKKLRDSGDANGSGHSSPGILLLIARHLLNRAESMLANDLSSVEKAVHGAVLANDALELLGGKTPTTAAEALSLKHRFELHLECQFTGVEHHIPLHHRFKEIKRDAESISRWFRPQERRRAALNIQMNIINQLICILRQYNQFDEEQECMNRVRHLHNSLYIHEHPWRRFLTWPILRYSEFLLSSFSRFTIALIVWIAGLTLLFGLRPENKSPPDEINSFQPFGQAISTFLGVDPGASHGPWLIALSVFAIIAGLAHLGIFISHLYVLVSKR